MPANVSLFMQDFSFHARISLLNNYIHIYIYIICMHVQLYTYICICIFRCFLSIYVLSLVVHMHPAWRPYMYICIYVYRIA